VVTVVLVLAVIGWVIWRFADTGQFSRQVGDLHLRGDLAALLDGALATLAAFAAAPSAPSSSGSSSRSGGCPITPGSASPSAG
jgi:glutamate transport system permease protein